MEHLIIAFHSRAHTVRFSNLLRQRGISNLIVNTPKEAGVGCGLSVEVRKEAFSLVKRLLRSSKIDSFAGFFKVYESNGRRIVTSI